MSFNHITLKGNLTRDPEVKFLKNGTAVCNLGIAVNRVWKDENGNKMEECMFIDCTAWGQRGETISEYFSKGDQILIAGRLDLQTWEDKNTGDKRSKHIVTVETFDFCSGKKDSDGSGKSRQSQSGQNKQNQRQQGNQGSSQGRNAQPPQDDPDDDIPF
jgi:single-strand DNA-binding protein